MTEAKFRRAEAQLIGESQQRDLAMSMAREVGTGQAAVYHQFELDRTEQAAQAGRMNTSIADAGVKVEFPESRLQETRSQNEEYTHLMLGSISSI